MSQRIDLQRFFRWLSVDRSKVFGFGRRARHLFAPHPDALETRRLLTLSVLIDDSNNVQISPGYPGYIGPLSESIDMSYDQNTSTYTITSYNSESSFFIASDNSFGLSVLATPYSGSGNFSTLKIQQLLGTVSTITLTTGDAPDTVAVGRSPAALFINTGGSSDIISQTTGNYDTQVYIDGGSGDDTVQSNYIITGIYNIKQNIYGSDSSNELAIDTTIAANASAKYINVRMNNVENVRDYVDSASSNLTVTINGADGLPNGGYLDRTSLTSLDVRPFTNTKTVNLFGYETNDDIQLFLGAYGTTPFVGITGTGLPRTDLYDMDPVHGILKLRTLGGDDVVKANAGVEAAIRISVEGGAGDDSISADATLIGGSGDDTLEGGAGNDSIDGGLGDDIIVLTGGTDTYVGGGGFDTVYMHGHGGFNHNLSITQDQGVPAVFFENGVTSNVTMIGISQISVQGSAGNDSLTISGTSTSPVPVLAFMGAGADSIGTTSASAQQVVIAYGEAGQDTFDAGAGWDTFYGGDDADIYVATPNEASGDTYDGGSGENLLAAIGSDIVLIDLTGVLTLFDGFSGYVSAFSVSSVNIQANAPGNNDILLQADAGDNTILVTDSTTNPTLQQGDVEVTGLMVPVYISGLGAGDNLTVSGNAGADSFTAKGSAGANLSFQGGVGMDTFYVLPSSTAANFGGDSADVVKLSGSLGADTVNLSSGPGVTFLGLNGTVQTISDVRRYVIETWGGNDNIVLSTIEDLDLTVGAGEGNDSVDATGVAAAGANVRILGGDGNDYIQGPAAAVTYISGGSGDDPIVLFAAALVFGDGGDDFISGSDGNDTIDGGDGNDQLYGGLGNDVISTGPGLNIVVGGEGNDNVYGGPDADLFYWYAGDGFDILSGGGGEDHVAAIGGGGVNDFQVLRQGTSYYLTYNGIAAFIAHSVPSIVCEAGIGSTATGFVDNMAGISVERISFSFGQAATADATLQGSAGSDNLLVGKDPVYADVLAVAGLSYQMFYQGESTSLATSLTVQGLDGNDTIKATTEAQTLSKITFDGGQGDDFLSADATLIGGPGNDTLAGGTGDDSLVGNEGDDLFLISSGNDSVDGGAGFDILQVAGATGATNAFSIDQSTGLPAAIQVNALTTTVRLVDVDQISVQGSTGDDTVVITGNSLGAVPILATLGLGNDEVDANQASAGQRTDAYGEGGDDYFISGPGTDYFYGGDDYDKFDAMYNSIDSFDYFDGGSGYNDLYVEGSAFGSNVITAIPSGYRVTNTSGTGVTTALNIGSVMVDTAGLGVYLYASNGDNVIRTFDSTSDLVPLLPVGQLLVTGMPGDITLLGVTAGTFVDIHGEGGNDTFQSLGNAEADVYFYGDSGEDRFIVTQESKFASFTGGAGTDTVAITGTVYDDSITLEPFGASEIINYNASPTGGGAILGAEVVSIDALAGDDNVTMLALNPATGLAVFQFALGAGNDFASVSGVPSGTFEISGGEGNDTIFGSDSPLVSTFRGDGGDDLIAAGTGPIAAYGGDGNDSLNGSIDRDTLDGGAGNDTLLAGHGSDMIDGGPDQDVIVWFYGDGSDNVAGGTGQDSLIVYGDWSADNAFTLKPQVVLANLFEVLIAGNVIGGGEIEHVRLNGGTGSDTFSIDNLSQTSITLVDVSFGFDTSADTVSVKGTAGKDYVIMSGSDVTTIDGLPWLVRVDGAQFSATTLVDGILFDGNLGEDTIVSSVNLTSPVLVTIKGGAGADDIRVNSPTLGDNPNRVLVDLSDDLFGDVVQLGNGRNKVLGSAVDVIMVNGSANDDLIEVLPEVGGRTRISQSLTGFSSSNDLTGFSGVVHIDGQGGNDDIVALAALRATIWGGDGNDRIYVGPAGSLVYAGSGDDLVRGGIGNDTFYGGSGNDSLVGQEGDDVLFGEAGDDLLEGGLGMDNLLGGDDSDLLEPGKNGTGNVEFVDGGGGLDQLRFDMNARSGLIGHTAGFLNVGEFGGVGPSTAFNAVDAEDLLVMVDSTVPGSTGYDLTIYDLTGTQVSFARVNFLDPADQNTLALRGTVAADVIDANYIVPPGGEPEAQVLMPWGTVWAYTPGSTTPQNTLAIAGDAGDDVIKVSDYLSQGAFAWNIQVDGEDGNDYLSADATITGGAGNDTLVGGSGNDSLLGNDGDDLFLLSGGLDTFVGGAGFDIVQAFGSVGANNAFAVTQNTAVPVSIDVNATNYQVDMSEIDQISVQGSNGDDILFIDGSLASPIAVLGMMGDGYDQVMTYNASAGQLTTIYGQEGNDVMISGPGTDYFYGGNDYDYFEISTNSYDSYDWFDGGSGFNELYVDLPPAGTTTVAAIPSGFYVTNSAYIGSTTALNIGYLQIDGGGGGGGIVINGSNNDDTIRTFDSTSDLVPPLPPATMLVTGLGSDINILGIVPGQVIDIHGQGGNDTFQSLGNAQSVLTFYGDSGDDRFVVTQESKFASFVGGAGTDTVSITGTVYGDSINLTPFGPGQVINYNGNPNGGGSILAAEVVSIDALAGDDNITIPALNPATGLAMFEIALGAGNDFSSVAGLVSGTFSITGGEGNDSIFGPGGTAVTSVWGDGGNDMIVAGAAPITAYGDDGNDNLSGSSGNDTLDGGAGDDTLTAGQGNDQVYGGPDQDIFNWSEGDGNDTYDGGTGQDSLYARGWVSLPNTFVLSSQEAFANLYRLVVNGARIEGGEVEHVSMVGGAGADSFAIGDLSQTAITLVDSDFGQDTAADRITVLGTADDDTILLTGENGNAEVTGLPWLVRVKDILISGNTLVDGVSIDAGYGYDWIRSGYVASSPMLITINGGQGADFIEFNTPNLGDNVNRGTILAANDFFADRIRITNGRTIVYGAASDVIEVLGTENADTVSLSGLVDPGRVVFNVNGVSSSNDLTNFAGVIHVDLMGQNDTATLAGYGVPTSVMAGDGNDLVNAALMTVPVSLYGGSGNDSLTAGSANDYLSGGDGNDRLIGGQGNDSIDGGAGDDFTSWIYGDGSDTIDGGSGANYSVFSGNLTNGNVFTLKPNLLNQQAVDLSIADGTGFLSGVILASSVGQFDLTGGTGEDRFTIEDLTGTSVTKVNTDFGVDTVADRLKVYGTANDDSIKLIGAVTAQVTGLPWVVNAANARMNGDLLVDGVDIDGGLGYDYLGATGDLGSPVLVTLNGGRGSDIINAATPYLGVNPVRVVVEATAGTLGDTIRLLSGRNQVLSSSDDVIIVDGTVNNDTVSLTQTLEGTVFDVNGRTSTNDLTGFLGVIHVELMGGNDTATLAGYTVPTSVMGGDGNDLVNAALMSAPVSLYGGSGDDRLIAGSANDYLDGGDGYDQITGNAGNDSIEGGSGSDAIFYQAGDGNDLVDGGDGMNMLYVNGLAIAANNFSVSSSLTEPTEFAIDLNGVSNAIVAAAIQGLVLKGGTASDSFAIADMSGTSLQNVTVDLVQDTAPDSVIWTGTDQADEINVHAGPNGSVQTGGLAVLATVINPALGNGGSVVDTITANGSFGFDRMIASPSLGSIPVGVALNGNGGSDLLIADAPALGSAPRVTLNGGAMDDTFWLQNGNNVVIGDALDKIEVFGSPNNDTINATGNATTLVLDVNGLTSTNIVSQFQGVLNINALGGNDAVTLAGYMIPTSVMGGDGRDRIDASAMTVSTTLYGESGNDTLYGGSADDEIDGGSGNDEIRGNQGIDSLSGGDGNDNFTWFSGDGLDYVDGGDGDDWAVYNGTGNADNVFGVTPLTIGGPSSAAGLGLGNSNRVLVTHNTADIAHIGDVEALTVNGGNDCDTIGIGNLQTTDLRIVDVVFSLNSNGGVVSTWATNLPDTITVVADSPNQIGINGLAVPVRVFNTLPTSAVVVHAGFGADNIEVDPQAEAQAIIVVDGGAGNDTITGGSIIIGGPGNNVLIGTDAPNTIVGGTGSDSIYGLGAGDTLFGDAEVLNVDIIGPDCKYIENLIILPTTTGAPDLIEGGEGDDFINGNIGADSISGGNGNDDIGALTYKGVYFPEPGNDQIDAGEGDNCVFSGDGNDVVKAGNGNNLIVLGEGDDIATTGNGNNSVFGGAGNDTVTTGAGNDVVALGAGDDKATLGSGDDIAWGDDGNDFIIGQYGNDSLYGGNGNDTLWGGLQATAPLTRGQKHAVLTPFDGNDVLAGNDGFDQLDGGTGDNVMDAGADYIRETMVGSGGWDTAYIHKDEGSRQDVLKNHSKRYTLIPYGSMLIPVTPATPTDCNSPIIVNVPNPLAGAQAAAPKKKALPKATAPAPRTTRGR